MRDRRLYFLGPESRVNQRVFTALGAFLRHRCGVSAKMTAQSRHVAMERERDAAVRAIPRHAAITAKQRGRKSAPIQKQDRLLAFFQPRRNRLRQFLRKNRSDLTFSPFLAK